MTRKTDERIEEIEEWKRKREIEDGIRKGLNKWAHTVCITATSAVITCVYNLGAFIYRHLDSFTAAVKAYLAAERGGQ